MLEESKENRDSYREIALALLGKGPAEILQDTLNLDYGKFLDAIEDNLHPIHDVMPLLNITAKDLSRKYWRETHIPKLINAFRSEIVDGKSRTARLFVGEIIQAAKIPVPDWYSDALIEADRLPRKKAGKKDKDTETMKKYLRAGTLYGLINWYKTKLGYSIADDAQNHVSQFIPCGRTTAHEYKSKSEEMLDSDFFNNQTTLTMLIGILKIDIRKFASQLGISHLDF